MSKGVGQEEVTELVKAARHGNRQDRQQGSAQSQSCKPHHEDRKPAPLCQPAEAPFYGFKPVQAQIRNRKGEHDSETCQSGFKC